MSVADIPGILQKFLESERLRIIVKKTAKVAIASAAVAPRAGVAGGSTGTALYGTTKIMTIYEFLKAISVRERHALLVAVTLALQNIIRVHCSVEDVVLAIARHPYLPEAIKVVIYIATKQRGFQLVAY